MSGIRPLPHSVIRCLVLLVLLGGIATTAAAQRAHLGPRVGGNFTLDDALVGAQLSVPLSGWLDFYPSADAYFPRRGTRLGFNVDLKARFPVVSSFGFYTGGGLNVMYREIGNVSNTGTGVNLLGGIESHVGWVHPFAEARLLWHDPRSFQLMTGINVTLGNRRR